MGRSKEKTLCWDKLDTPPPMPDSTLWKDSTLLRDHFWEKVDESPINDQPAENNTPIFCHMNAPEDSCMFPDPSMLIRFRVETGDMPTSVIDFSSKSSKPGGWDKWFEAIDKIPDFRFRLKKAGIYDAIRVSIMNDIKRDVNAMEILVSRWCSMTHTFVAAWGEFTPTLEDVIKLLRLPVYGYADLVDFDLSPVEQEAVSSLRKILTKSSSNKPRLGKSQVVSDSRGKRPNYAAWIRVFFEERLGDHVLPGDESNSPHVLAAFIALWLSRYVFTGPPCDGLSPRVLPLAVKMAGGFRFSLAPAYLGSLYKRLDESLDAFVRSKGRYVFQCFADCNFLQMFLFEHFPKIAPQKAIHSQGGPRAWCWHKSRVTSRFQSYIDDEADFVFRPYRSSPWWAEESEGPFRKELRTGKFAYRDDTPKDDLLVLLMVQPYTFVALLEHELPEEGHRALSSAYNPHRVARQFGYEQGRPMINPNLIEVNAASSSVLFVHIRKLHPDVQSLQIPSLDRQGGTSVKWVHGWRNALDGFKIFLASPPRVIPTTNVTCADPVLRLPKKPSHLLPSEIVVEDASPPKQAAKKIVLKGILIDGTVKIPVGHAHLPSLKTPLEVKSQGMIPLMSVFSKSVLLQCKKSKTFGTSCMTKSVDENGEESEEEDQQSLASETESEETEYEVADEGSEMSRFEEERKRKEESEKSKRQMVKKEKEQMSLEAERWKMAKEKDERERVVKDRKEREVNARKRSFENREVSNAGVSPSKRPRMSVDGDVFVEESSANVSSSIFFVDDNGVVQQAVKLPIAKSPANLACDDAATRQSNEGCQVEWRGTLLTSSTALTLKRIIARHGDIFENMLHVLPRFLSATVESLAEVVQLLDSITPTSFTAEDLRYIEMALLGIKCFNVRLDWLDSTLSTLCLLRDRAIDKMEVERLEKVVAEASLSLEESRSRYIALEAKIETDSNIVFDRPLSFNIL